MMISSFLLDIDRFSETYNWQLYISEEEKKKAEQCVRPLVFVVQKPVGTGRPLD